MTTTTPKIPGAGQVVNLPVLIPDDLAAMLAPTDAANLRSIIAQEIREMDPAWLRSRVEPVAIRLSDDPHAVALQIIATAIEEGPPGAT